MANLINSTEMAKILGITKQSFGDGVRSGRFTPAGRGKFGHPLFNPAEVKKQYANTRVPAELQDHAHVLPSEMRGGRPTEEDKTSDKTIMKKIIMARYAKDATQAKLQELKFKVQSGLYIEKEKARRQGIELGEMIMGVLQSWPSRLAPEFAGMREADEHDFLHRLEQEVNTLIMAIRRKLGGEDGE
jgi:phage terminase Nu1 subunit (DNA packaging protein)